MNAPMQSYSVLGQRDRLSVPTELGFFIDGAWRRGEGTRLDQIHPASSELVTTVADATASEVDAAVRAAWRAFDEGPWPRMRARERIKLLRRFVDLVYERADDLAYLQTLDNGIPIHFSINTRVSPRQAADIWEHYVGWVDKISGEFPPQFTDQTNLQMITMREPVGVVAAILPWNAPGMQFVMKVAPALACGCTVVLKASEKASLIAHAFAGIISEIGLPEGVFNFVTGGPATGDALVRHPGVDKISFTGSRATGGRIAAIAGNDIKRLTLELGGKSAALVFPDCTSVENVAAGLMGLCSTFLSGQVCSTTTRAIVHKSIYDRFIDAAAKQTEGVRFGDPFDFRTTSAPIIDRKQADRVMDYIEAGREEGARLVTGGRRETAGALAAGNWVAPTLFADVDNRMRIAREEIFGPVLSVIPFDEEDEAVRLANDSSYGLSGGLYTRDLSRAFRVTRAMRTGSVGVNGYSVMPNAPAGGMKESGIGREGGWHSIEAFTELKTMIINLDG
jgi:aldehyde dehydrogenase (NAD+)